MALLEEMYTFYLIAANSNEKIETPDRGKRERT